MARSRYPSFSSDPLLMVLVSAALLEMVWTVYLGWRLPRHYVAHHWAMAWVGLDVAQVLGLLACAWAAWRARAVLILFATALGTLLLVDAWFDVTTARRGSVLESVLMALLVEVPSALALFWIARRSAKRLARTFFTTTGSESVALRRLPIPRPPDDRQS